MAFGTRWDVRTQGPIALDPRSEPEPDVSVVRGSPRDYRDAHPTSPALVVEVALASLRLDRTRKCRAFARAGVPEYWIVNLLDRALEVHREPALLDAARRRWGYRSIQALGPDAVVSPLAAPAARVVVADLLPWARRLAERRAGSHRHPSRRLKSLSEVTREALHLNAGPIRRSLRPSAGSI